MPVKKIYCEATASPGMKQSMSSVKSALYTTMYKFFIVSIQMKRTIECIPLFSNPSFHCFISFYLENR